jgi:Family of unknown function (DUF6152)
MQGRPLGFAPLFICALISVPLFAHHGTGSSYDSSKAFDVKATITEFHYANPHPQLFFDVKDEKGNVVHWSAEIGPNPAQLVQAGWGKRRSEKALAPGTEVTITLSPSRAGTHVGLANKIVGADGQLILVTFGNVGGKREGQ